MWRFRHVLKGFDMLGHAICQWKMVYLMKVKIEVRLDRTAFDGSCWFLRLVGGRGCGGKVRQGGG